MVLDDSKITVAFPRNTAIIYEGGLTSVQPNHLHVPKARIQVALDSFFLLDQSLYIFQFTAVDNHDIQPRMEESLHGLLEILPPKANWCFVFITPPDCKVDVEVPSAVAKFLEGVTVYLAHLEI